MILISYYFLNNDYSNFNQIRLCVLKFNFFKIAFNKFCNMKERFERRYMHPLIKLIIIKFN